MTPSFSALPAPVFVDASVLVAAENAHERALQAACVDWLEALWAARMGRVSQEELVRFYAACTHAAPQPMPQGDARAAIRRYQTWQAWALDGATLESAWAVEARQGLPWAACLTVAAAQHSGCHWLLSLQLGQLGQLDVPADEPGSGLASQPGATVHADCTLAGVHVLNPARVSPALFLQSI